MPWKPLLALCALSCATSQSAPPANPPPAGAEPTAATPAESAPPAAEAAPAPAGAIDWDSMDKAARGKYMKETVLPKMKEVFAAFDAKKYADVKCITCHGSTAMKGNFTMPNPELPPLPADMSKFKEWTAKKPEMAEFMAKHVKPEMAKLLNLPEWSPGTPNGFGCGACHTTAKN
jgi:hypothetical protein